MKDIIITQDDLISIVKEIFGDAKPPPAILSPGAEERMRQIALDDNLEIPKYTIVFGDGEGIKLEKKFKTKRRCRKKTYL